MAGDCSYPRAQTMFPFHHLCVARDMCKLGCPSGTTHRHCNWDAAVAWKGFLWHPTRGDAHCCRLHLDYGTYWADSGARPGDTALCHLNPTCRRKHENYDPFNKQIRSLFYAVVHHFRNSMDFWKAPRLCMFALLTRATCRWKWVRSIGRMTLPGGKGLLLKTQYVPRSKHFSSRL